MKTLTQKIDPIPAKLPAESPHESKLRKANELLAKANLTGLFKKRVD